MDPKRKRSSDSPLVTALQGGDTTNYYGAGRRVTTRQSSLPSVDHHGAPSHDPTTHFSLQPNQTTSSASASLTQQQQHATSVTLPPPPSWDEETRARSLASLGAELNVVSASGFGTSSPANALMQALSSAAAATVGGGGTGAGGVLMRHSSRPGMHHTPFAGAEQFLNNSNSTSRDLEAVRALLSQCMFAVEEIMHRQQPPASAYPSMRVPPRPVHGAPRPVPAVVPNSGMPQASSDEELDHSASREGASQQQQLSRSNSNGRRESAPRLSVSTDLLGAHGSPHLPAMIDVDGARKGSSADLLATAAVPAQRTSTRRRKTPTTTTMNFPSMMPAGPGPHGSFTTTSAAHPVSPTAMAPPSLYTAHSFVTSTTELPAGGFGQSLDVMGAGGGTAGTSRGGPDRRRTKVLWQPEALNSGAGGGGGGGPGGSIRLLGVNLDDGAEPPASSLRQTVRLLPSHAPLVSFDGAPGDLNPDASATTPQLTLPGSAGGGGDSSADAASATGDGSAGAKSVMGGRVAAALQKRLENHRLLASSPVVVALDIGYVLFTLVIGIITTAYIAFDWKARSADNYLNVPACVAVVITAQVYSLLWLGSRFVVQTRRGEWDVIDGVADIAKHYRSTWLALDLLSAVPIELIFIGWRTDLFFWMQVRQVLRIVRLVSLVRSGNPLHERRNWMALLAFVAVVLFFIHSAALMFMDLEDGTYDVNTKATRTIDYVDALYWASMTLTSVGYGDVLPTASDGHRIYACLVMFSGVAMVASMTAFATSFLTGTDALQDAIRERKQMLASMIKHYRIPWEVQVEIIALLPSALSAENEQKFTQLISHMPAFMVERIEGYTRAKALSTSIPLFAELPITVVLELTAKLQQRFYQANETIIEIGEDGNEMFFMVTGLAEVVVPIFGEQELVVAVLRGGSFFGEMALVQDVKRTASVIAVSLCELLVLSKTDFTQLIARHKELQRIFLAEVFARHNVTSIIKKDVDQMHRSLLRGSNSMTEEVGDVGEDTGSEAALGITVSAPLASEENNNATKATALHYTTTTTNNNLSSLPAPLLQPIASFRSNSPTRRSATDAGFTLPLVVEASAAVVAAPPPADAGGGGGFSNPFAAVPNVGESQSDGEPEPDAPVAAPSADDHQSSTPSRGPHHNAYQQQQQQRIRHE